MAWFLCNIGGTGGLTLTVTCDSSFAGLTITCTDGDTTLTKTCPSQSPYAVEFMLPNGGTWTISGQGASTTINVIDSTELHVIPSGSSATPVNDIQTWLHCGNIWDKNYTTISEVLADATTLLALISSNNAADYMARSTTWASNVTANSTAMTYIGANNYCANKLLANSTWLSAICNSTYIESVLNVKVPTMTSNTTPSGQVLYSSQAANSAFRVFDGDNATSWQPQTGNDGYIGYMFTNPCVVKCIAYTPASNDVNRSLLGIFEGSNDGSTYTTIQNFNNQKPTESVKLVLSNNTSYKYYRLNVKRSTAYDTSIPTLQFYGRA